MAESAENFDLAHWELQQLVASGQYADERAALRSALRAVFQRAPERKMRMVISAYEAGEIGLGKAAALLGVPQEQMKEILCEAGATIHLVRARSRSFTTMSATPESTGTDIVFDATVLSNFARIGQFPRLEPIKQ